MCIQMPMSRKVGPQPSSRGRKEPFSWAGGPAGDTAPFPHCLAYTAWFVDRFPNTITTHSSSLSLLFLTLLLLFSFPFFPLFSSLSYDWFSPLVSLSPSLPSSFSIPLFPLFPSHSIFPILVSLSSLIAFFPSPVWMGQ